MQQTLKRTRRSHVGHHCGLLTKNLCAVLKERWGVAGGGAAGKEELCR